MSAKRDEVLGAYITCHMPPSLPLSYRLMSPQMCLQKLTFSARQRKNATFKVVICTEVPIKSFKEPQCHSSRHCSSLKRREGANYSGKALEMLQLSHIWGRGNSCRTEVLRRSYRKEGSRKSFNSENNADRYHSNLNCSWPGRNENCSNVQACAVWQEGSSWIESFSQ